MPYSESLLLAYQPIFDRQLNTVGGELLFRSDDGTTALQLGDTKATSALLYNLCTGISEQFEGFNQPLFVNVSEELLQSEAFLPIEPNRVIIELVERIKPTPEFVEQVKRWHEHGFRFAFDDFEYSSEWEALLPYCDIIKIDIQSSALAKVRQLRQQLSSHQLTWLAERIETPVEFELYKSLGFDQFQGYFFARPLNINGMKIPPDAANFVAILQALQDPNISIDALNDLIAQQPTLAMQLLKIANSAFFRGQSAITSLRQALVRLGLAQIKKWVILISALKASNPAATQFVLARALTCAEAAKTSASAPVDPDSAFLAGMLSASDILLKVDRVAFVQSLQVAPAIRRAATEQQGELGALIQRVEAIEASYYQVNNTAPIGQSVTPSPDDSSLFRRYGEIALECQQLCNAITDTPSTNPSGNHE